jgi:hypothetical protein
MTTAAVEEQPATEQPIEERPMHGAVCDECKHTVAFRMTASGGGFMVINHGYEDHEVSFGVGPNGGPMCPLGHGEMTVADDRLPASEAIGQVADAVAQRIPFANPAFNDENALEAIFAKNHEFEGFEKVYLDLKEKTKRAKDDMDECAVEQKKLIQHFEQAKAERQAENERRAAAVARGEDPDAPLEKCRFEQLHPGVPCPQCSDPIRRAAMTVAPGSEEHGVEAHRVLHDIECARTVAQLASVAIFVNLVELNAMSLEDLATVQAWAGDAADHPEERERWMGDGLPKGLGRPHVAGEPVGEGQQQTCTACGGFIGLEDGPVFPAGALVGTNCEGKAKSTGQRYPKRGSKKGARRGVETA